MLNRQQKEQLIEKIIDQIKNSKIVILTNYQGLSVEAINNLRNSLAEQGIKYQVVKNTLLLLAIKKNKLNFDRDLINNQPIALASSLQDEVIPAKILKQFTKEHEHLNIVGGFYGQEYQDAEFVNILAAIPSRDELNAKVVGSIASPLSGMVRVLNANLFGLVSVIKQYAESK